MTGTTPAANGDDNGNGKRPRRAGHVLATLGLVVVTAGAVGGLIWGAVVQDDASASTTLGLIATTGIGALAILAGAKRAEKNDQNGEDR